MKWNELGKKNRREEDRTNQAMHEIGTYTRQAQCTLAVNGRNRVKFGALVSYVRLFRFYFVFKIRHRSNKPEIKLGFGPFFVCVHVVYYSVNGDVSIDCRPESLDSSCVWCVFKFQFIVKSITEYSPEIGSLVFVPRLHLNVLCNMRVWSAFKMCMQSHSRISIEIMQ